MAEIVTPFSNFHSDMRIYNGGSSPVDVTLAFTGASVPNKVKTIGAGETLAVDNVLPTLWRIDPESFAVTVHPLALNADTDKDVGFAAVVYSAEHAAFIAYSGVQRSVWKIDPALKTAERIAQADLTQPRSRGRRCAELPNRLIQLAATLD